MNQETLDFLKDFKALEDRLVLLSGLRENYVSFSRALDIVHKERKNPVVAEEENYRFLQTASDLRNILSHENGVCEVTPGFESQFKAYVQEIINPVQAENICTKGDQLVFGSLSTPLKELCLKMGERHISHVPIVDRAGLVVGVFSMTSFFQRYYQEGKLVANGDDIIADFVKEVGIEGHLNEEYFFVGRKTPAYSLLNYFVKKESGAKRVSCLFVTEHGKKDERLFGVITEADLLKLPIYERKMLRD
jgi:CBS domain-containing protein